MLVNLGTGIGGGIVLDGRVLRGRFGIAGEFGHMQVVPDGIRCECGNRGCWEQYASGNALVREARALMTADSPVATDLLERVGGRPRGADRPARHRGGARRATPSPASCSPRSGAGSASGIANLAAALDPGTFVVGGGVSAAGELLLAPAREAFRRQLTGRGYRPEARIVAAELGNEAGLVGAADLARLGAAGLAWADAGDLPGTVPPRRHAGRPDPPRRRLTRARRPAAGRQLQHPRLPRRRAPARRGSCGPSTPTSSASRRCRAGCSPAGGCAGSPGGAGCGPPGRTAGAAARASSSRTGCGWSAPTTTGCRCGGRTAPAAGPGPGWRCPAAAR